MNTIKTANWYASNKAYETPTVAQCIVQELFAVFRNFYLEQEDEKDNEAVVDQELVEKLMREKKVSAQSAKGNWSQCPTLY